MKKRLMFVLMLVCVVMSFTGIVIWFVLQGESNLEENTVIDLNGETSKSLKAELAGFYPGCEREYSIVLKGDLSDDYYVELDFRSDSESGGLESYLVVTIKTDSVTIERQLRDLLDNGKIELGKNANEITIIYAMPGDVGNEAQGTSATFYVDVSAKNA